MQAFYKSLVGEFIPGCMGSQFIIPVYQRTYTWKSNEEVKQFLTDIENIAKGKNKRHFIGNIVFLQQNGNGMIVEKEIVDGQQRLITTYLIIYAVREYLREHGNDDYAKQITANFLENNAAGANHSKYRLQPSAVDDKAFECIVTGKTDDSIGKSNIRENYDFIRSSVFLLIEKYGYETIYDALRKLDIVYIQLDDCDDAQQIFESINYRGSKLNAADLIRNFILMDKISSEQERLYRKYWLPMEQTLLDSKSIAEFFRFYIAIKTYNLVSEAKLYGVFKDYWYRHIDLGEEVLLNEIQCYFEHYRTLYFASIIDKDFSDAVVEYRKMWSKMPAPFAMEVLELHRQGKIKGSVVKKVLNLINIYLVRRYLSNEDSNVISRAFPQFLKNIVEQVGLGQSYEHFYDICVYYFVNNNISNSAFMPDDVQLIDYLKCANAYILDNMKIILDRIELDNNPAPVDVSKLSIEHIMPQTINDYWHDISRLEGEEYVKTINLLGNLTLATKPDNSKMSNKDFERKKDVLKKTGHLKLNEEILLKDKWTVADINTRTIKLCDKIIELYPYCSSTFKPVEFDGNRDIYLDIKEIHASGYLDKKNRVIVKKDSIVRLSTLPIAKTLIEKRKQLIKNGILSEQGSIGVFTEDYTFSSPSAAADFIIGGSNNGWEKWKNEEGIIIDECLRDKE